MKVKTVRHLKKWAIILTVALGIGNVSSRAAQSPAPARPNRTVTATYNRVADHHPFMVFMQEGGWCWFQDPRAIIHDKKLFMGSVQGNGSGPALVGVYDLEARKPLGATVMQNSFRKDDHNSPVFHVRPDGSVLAMYALHGTNKIHYSRMSDQTHALVWGEEQTYLHDYPKAGNVTYTNLYEMRKEGTLYNFFRGIDWNPSFITSRDHGLTWGEGTHLIKSELAGTQRPYVRYTGNGIDTVHISFTDAHPHHFGNNIYYAAFREGRFFRANGELIKDLKKDGALAPHEAEKIFLGSGMTETEAGSMPKKAAWTNSIALDGKEFPHIGYSVHITNRDHRYRIASWNSKQWIDREVAFAGHCLYETEASYTGLISLDPVDPTSVVISTNVDPSTGEYHGGHHEIYRANVHAGDDINTVKWEAVTISSPVRNLRPVIVRGDGFRVLTWLRGDYLSYTNYQMDVVGIIEETQNVPH